MNNSEVIYLSLRNTHYRPYYGTIEIGNNNSYVLNNITFQANMHY